MAFSTTMTEDLKTKTTEILKVDYMSSEDSDSISSGDELATAEARRPRKLLCRPLPWRSEEATAVLRSLDRKYGRRQTAQGRQMTAERVEGARSERPRPDDMPEWAIEDFIL